MKSTAEEKILNNLIEVNLDACSFYREAADNTAVPLAERTFHDLERIHTGIVEGLALAAYRNGNTRPPDQAIGKQKLKIFGNLRMVARAGLVSAVENAENLCIKILEQAIDSDEVSTDIKMHVLDAVTMLY
ncbi:MAG: hypothetical protein V1721_06225, partial [Pseudomonadota bacterium]